MDRAPLLVVAFVSVCGVVGCSTARETSTFDPPTQAATAKLLTSATPLGTARAHHAAVRLDSGDVLVAGGNDATSAALTSCEVYSPLSHTWSPAPPMNRARTTLGLAKLPGGDVIAWGGDYDGYERRNVTTGTWALVAGTAPTRRRWSTWFQRSDGSIVVVGGRDDTTVAQPRLADTWLFDAGLGSWAPGPSLTRPRESAGAIPLDADRFAVLGGLVTVAASGDAGASSAYQSDVEICTLSTSACVVGAVSMTDRRARFTTTKLLDGRWLIAGGYGSGAVVGVIDATEIFDPSGLTVVPGPRLAIARSQHAAVLLPSGQVLLAGGDVSSMPNPDAGLLADSGADPSDPVELVDVALGVARLGPWPQKERFAPTATLLSSGDVLYAAGGVSNWFALGRPVYADVDLFSQGIGGAKCSAPGDCVSGLCTAGACVGGTLPDAGPADSAKSDVGADATPVDAADGSVDVSVDVGVPAPDAPAAPDAAPAPEVGLSPGGATPAVSGLAIACGKDAECASGHCVDGVCCDGACVGSCLSCALAASPGVCSFVPFGLDPRGSCGAPSRCVSTCDGHGACANVTGAAVCSPATCVGPSRGVGIAVCAGAGSQCDTTARVEFECAPYACLPAFGTCASRCAVSTDCASGAICDPATGLCEKLAEPSSSGCALPSAGGLGDRAAIASAAIAFALVLAGRRRRPR